MKVTHHGDEHLLCLTSEEVGLLVDLVHAGAFSDHLPPPAPSAVGWRASSVMCAPP